jgi:hypothetical protein
MGTAPPPPHHPRPHPLRSTPEHRAALHEDLFDFDVSIHRSFRMMYFLFFGRRNEFAKLRIATCEKQGMSMLKWSQYWKYKARITVPCFMPQINNMLRYVQVFRWTKPK